VLTPSLHHASVPCMTQITVPTEPATIPLTIRFPRELHSKLIAEAERRSTPAHRVALVELIRDLIDKGC
jgi:hypothetical protein